MRKTNATRCAVTGLGAAAVLGFIMAGPALADPAAVGALKPTPPTAMPHQGPPSYNTWGAATMPQQGPPSYNSWPAQKVPPASVVLSTPSAFDVDYAQVGVGALGGAFLAGVTVLGVASARGRRGAAHA